MRGLRTPFVGRTIQAVWYDRASVVRLPSAEQFVARIVGQTVQAITRRAKYIVCHLDHDLFAIHLKMTGRLYVAPDGQSVPALPDAEGADRWVRLRLSLDNGQALYFSDARRFGKVFLAANLHEFAPALGPEPLEDDFTPALLRQRLTGRRAIKAALLDQSVLAGVGNIYADESLHCAGIHPQRALDSLSDAEITRLHGTIRAALQAGIDHQGASVDWYRKPDGSRGESQDYLYVYDREGQPCLTCGSPIRKIRVAQRGTHFCPQCQPEAKG